MLTVVSKLVQELNRPRDKVIEEHQQSLLVEMINGRVVDHWPRCIRICWVHFFLSLTSLHLNIVKMQIQFDQGQTLSDSQPQVVNTERNDCACAEDRREEEERSQTAGEVESVEKLLLWILKSDQLALQQAKPSLI